MFYSEFLNLFFWKRLELLDRAVVFEQAWETPYSKFNSVKDDNIYENPFLLIDTGSVKTVLIINTTEVESGLQCLVSTVRPRGLVLERKRDLLGLNIKNIRYSTAINFSSRFPLFSPGTMVPTGHGRRRHYLDGGYIENTGTASMLEMIRLIKNEREYKEIIPVVIHLRFGTDSVETQGVSFF